jgi:hypothetical protein
MQYWTLYFRRFGLFEGSTILKVQHAGRASLMTPGISVFSAAC